MQILYISSLKLTKTFVTCRKLSYSNMTYHIRALNNYRFQIQVSLHGSICASQLIFLSKTTIYFVLLEKRAKSLQDKITVGYSTLSILHCIYTLNLTSKCI